MISIEKYLNKFAIGYMVNPTLHVNRAFIYQVEKCLKDIFHSNTHYGIKIQQRIRMRVLLR